MSNITIRNFGAIKEHSAPIEIKKVTFFIGNQGSGKSTVAKLIATFMWIEKALVRGDYDRKWFERKNRFLITFLPYHRIENYLKENTFIQYKGKAYIITYENEFLKLEEKKNNDYSLPQIMYVPSERNFIAYVKSPKGLKLSSDALKEFLTEFDDSKEIVKNLPLPINNNVVLDYDKLNDTLNLKGKDYKIKLTEASSGFQSFAPIYMVSRYLGKSVGKQSEIKVEMSGDEKDRFRKEVEKIYSSKELTEEQKRIAISVLSKKFNKTSFVNIVEEPEQNLFPTSQRDMLYSLLKINNEITANKLIITTHSPYLVNYVSVSVEAGKLKQGVIAEKGGQLSEIVPINADDLAIYQLKEEDGTIKLLDSYEGIPSDENFLNDEIGRTNELFADLLDLQ